MRKGPKGSSGRPLPFFEGPCRDGMHVRIMAQPPGIFLQGMSQRIHCRMVGEAQTRNLSKKCFGIPKRTIPHNV